MHTFDNDPDLQDSQEALLDDLEVRCTTNVATLRQAKATPHRVRVEIRPANACDRQGLLTELQTSELTEQGLAGIAPQPVMVGSVFHLQFDSSATDLAPVLAVCDRCCMLSDTSFDLRFRFAHPIDLNQG